MSHVERANWLIGPTGAADATGKRGVYCLAATGSVQNITLPSTWKTLRTTLDANGTGPFVKMKLVGCTGQYHFTSGNGSITLNQTTAIGTGNAATGWPLADGEEKDEEVPIGVDTLNILCSNNTGFIFLRMSEGGQ